MKTYAQELMFLQGQCIIGCVPFKNGEASLYRGPYVIVEVNIEAETIGILNISSVTGKEHKLAFSTNVRNRQTLPHIAATFAFFALFAVNSFLPPHPTPP